MDLDVTHHHANAILFCKIIYQEFFDDMIDSLLSTELHELRPYVNDLLLSQPKLIETRKTEILNTWKNPSYYLTQLFQILEQKPRLTVKVDKMSLSPTSETYAAISIFNNVYVSASKILSIEIGSDKADVKQVLMDILNNHTQYFSGFKDTRPIGSQVVLSVFKYDIYLEKMFENADLLKALCLYRMLPFFKDPLKKTEYVRMVFLTYNPERDGNEEAFLKEKIKQFDHHVNSFILDMYMKNIEHM